MLHAWLPQPSPAHPSPAQKQSVSFTCARLKHTFQNVLEKACFCSSAHAACAARQEGRPCDGAVQTRQCICNMSRGTPKPTTSAGLLGLHVRDARKGRRACGCAVMALASACGRLAYTWRPAAVGAASGGRSARTAIGGGTAWDSGPARCRHRWSVSLCQAGHAQSSAAAFGLAAHLQRLHRASGRIRRKSHVWRQAHDCPAMRIVQL